MEEFRRKGSHEKPSFSSVLHADKMFVKKIMSRNSSVDEYSSSLSNFKTPAEIPFKWESQPGKPKDPPKGSIDFSLSPAVDPPPAAVARGSVVSEVVPQTRASRVWKKLKNTHQKKVKKVEPAGSNGSDEFGRFPRSHYDNLRYSIASNSYDLSSSSSTAPSPSTSASASSSSSNGRIALHPSSSKLQNLAWGCVKWVF